MKIGQPILMSGRENAGLVYAAEEVGVSGLDNDHIFVDDLL